MSSQLGDLTPAVVAQDYSDAEFWGYRTCDWLATDVRACIAAVDSRTYLPPSRPPAPGVPRGGSTGAVTDPNAVDLLIADNVAAIRARNSEFFSRLPVSDPDPQPDPSEISPLVWVALGLGAIAAWKLLKD